MQIDGHSALGGKWGASLPRRIKNQLSYQSRKPGFLVGKYREQHYYPVIFNRTILS
jgi:hypothetical protein